MNEYIVQYIDNEGDLLYFKCLAEDNRHAIDQTLDAYPDLYVVRDVYINTKDLD